MASSSSGGDSGRASSSEAGERCRSPGELAERPAGACGSAGRGRGEPARLTDRRRPVMTVSG